MENAAVITLAGLCLGITLTGLLGVFLRQGSQRERLSLGLVYIAFIGLIALPLVKVLAEGALIYFMPVLLILLLTLPPTFFYYVAAKTTSASPTRVLWRDLALPLTGVVVCIGYLILPTQAKETLFISGELPSGILPTALTLLTFTLILIWPFVSFAYLIAVLRRLTSYRAHIRELFSNVENRDFRWVDVVMVLLVLIWAVGAFSLVEDNLTDGTYLIDGLLLALTAACLLSLNIFAPLTPPDLPPIDDGAELDPKYARSALTDDHAAKLAFKVEAAMRKDALYLDPSLSLQKLSKEVGALPNQVSQTLNQEIGSSFFDYVAHWRIEASKPMIMAGDTSVLAVALDVGFNSRSTFYKAFKRETGMTPKDYRAAQQSAA